MKTKPYILIGFLLIACAKDPVNQSAEEVHDKVMKIDQQTCQDTDSQASGPYELLLEEGQIECSDSDPQDFPDAQVQMNCTDAKSKFSCKPHKVVPFELIPESNFAKIELKGCIKADESIAMTSLSDLGLFNFVIKTIGATKTEDHTLVEIDANGEGRVVFATISSNSTGSKKSCRATFIARLEKVN